jgi:hypothetical protein
MPNHTMQYKVKEIGKDKGVVTITIDNQPYNQAHYTTILQGLERDEYISVGYRKE